MGNVLDALAHAAQVGTDVNEVVPETLRKEMIKNVDFHV